MQTNQLRYECQTFAIEQDKSSWDAGIIFAKKLSVLEMVIKFNFYAALHVCVMSCCILSYIKNNVQGRKDIQGSAQFKFNCST